MERARWFLSVLPFLLLTPFASQAQQIKLRVTLQPPPTNHLGVNLMQFKEEVERRADKAISIEIFDNSQLYKDDEVGAAVSSGAIEMGVTTTAWSR